jgi:hypothetical protein
MDEQAPVARPEPPGDWEYEIDGEVITSTFVPDDLETFERAANEDRKAARQEDRHS